MAEGQQNPASQSNQGPSGPATDEISLFDIWNVLVRRRWVFFGVFVLCLGAAVAYGFARPPVYELTQTIKIGREIPAQNLPTFRALRSMPEGGETDAGEPSDVIGVQGYGVADLSSAEVFEKPSEVASNLRELYMPQARAELFGDQVPQINLDSVTVEAIAESGLVRVTVEAPTEMLSQYADLFEAATKRLTEAHADIAQAQRDRIEAALREGRDAIATMKDRIETKRGRLEALSVEEKLIEEQIAELESFLKSVGGFPVKPDESQSSLPQPMMAMFISNELRKARQDVAELRQKVSVTVPNQRSALKTEISLLDRSIALIEDRVGTIQSRLGALSNTRVVMAPRRSDTSVGTPSTVIAGLGAVMGLIAGVLSAFFAEFVQAARSHRTTAG